MEAQRYRVFLQDEAPTIGSGWRILTVMKGRKWVRLLDERSKRRARLKVGLWPHLMMGGGKELPPRKKKRAKRLLASGPLR